MPASYRQGGVTGNFSITNRSVRADQTGAPAVKIITVTAAVAALIASAICVTAATAAPAPNQLRVGVADLDLDTSVGTMALDRRIRLAAGQVCAEAAHQPDLVMRACTRTCIDATVEEARADASRLRRSVVVMR